MLSQIEQLVEKENIRELKYRYFRGLDTNDWAVFESTMTESCVGLYSDGDVSFENREEIVSFMKEKLSGERMLTLHHGHHPEIEILDENTARGTWYLEDTVLILDAATRLYGTGIYEDRYEKVRGEWKIAHTGYKRLFECVEPLDEKHAVLKNMFSQ
ncbi:MAG: hypothetical protein ACI9JM_002491 [Halioglobus sp.]|jgi:hypothetical protein